MPLSEVQHFVITCFVHSFRRIFLNESNKSKRTEKVSVQIHLVIKENISKALIFNISK